MWANGLMNQISHLCHFFCCVVCSTDASRKSADPKKAFPVFVNPDEFWERWIIRWCCCIHSHPGIDFTNLNPELQASQRLNNWFIPWPFLKCKDLSGWKVTFKSETIATKMRLLVSRRHCEEEERLKKILSQLLLLSRLGLKPKSVLFSVLPQSQPNATLLKKNSGGTHQSAIPDRFL